MAHRVAAVLVWATLILAAPGAGQTIADAVRAVDEAVALTGLPQANPEVHGELAPHLEALRRSTFADWPVQEIAAALGERPQLSNLARLNSALVPRREAVALLGALDVSVTAASGVVENELTAALVGRLGATEAEVRLRPWILLNAALLEQSLADSVEKLRRFERKFGPGSARLNGLEVLANYLLQQTPGFGPDARGWPGAFEVVASYTPTYLTFSQDAPQLVSVGEFGLRRYLFGERWGLEGFQGILRPAFTTFGMAVAHEDDGAMRWPWKGQARVGAFASWGEIKVAFVGGDNRRLLVSRQFQIIPWAF